MCCVGSIWKQRLKEIVGQVDAMYSNTLDLITARTQHVVRTDTGLVIAASQQAPRPLPTHLHYGVKTENVATWCDLRRDECIQRDGTDHGFDGSCLDLQFAWRSIFHPPSDTWHSTWPHRPSLILASSASPQRNQHSPEQRHPNPPSCLGWTRSLAGSPHPTQEIYPGNEWWGGETQLSRGLTCTHSTDMNRCSASRTCS